MARLRDLAELVRAPAALSVPGDAVTGAAAAGSLGRRTPVLAAASVCLYWAGMAANDWADRDTDARDRPERPIPSGRVAPRTALGVAVGLTATGVALAAAAGGVRALSVAAPLAGAVWAYDLRFAGTLVGPAAMAVCRGLDVLLGASGGRWRQAIAPALTVAAHTYTVTALSAAEVRGASRILPGATLAATTAIAARAAVPSTVVSSVLALGYAGGYGAAQYRAIGDPSSATVRRAVSAGITSLPALQGALTARSGAPLAGAVVAAATVLGRRLARKLSPT
jgi:4-hydroxybenzoate polyprenyltransferase